MEKINKELIRNLKDIEKAFLELARETTGPKPETISWTAFQISETAGKAAEGLKRNVPQEMEIEGGGTTWWHVCPECNGAIDSQDRFCRHCGQAVKCK